MTRLTKLSQARTSSCIVIQNSAVQPVAGRIFAFHRNICPSYDGLKISLVIFRYLISYLEQPFFKFVPKTALCSFSAVSSNERTHVKPLYSYKRPVRTTGFHDFQRECRAGQTAGNRSAGRTAPNRTRRFLRIAAKLSRFNSPPAVLIRYFAKPKLHGNQSTRKRLFFSNRRNSQSQPTP